MTKLPERTLLAALAALGLAACGDESGAGTTLDVDTGGEIAPFDTVEDTADDVSDVSALDAIDTDNADGSGDADASPDAGDVGCNSSDDCDAGELCVDLITGPDNGFCTTRCQDDSQCDEGQDCIVIGAGEESYTACVDVDFCVDADDDGYGVGPGCLANDCDDEQAAINPGADEICNGVDDDCDELIDDNTVTSGDDCVTTRPGVCAEGRLACIGRLEECVPRVAESEEICDNLDNDCDGVVDEEATNAPTWYRDADEDRFGDDRVTLVQCARPEGYVDEGGDCDDDARAINPAAAEVCDGVDNDCDDTTDGPDATGTATVWEDSDGDGYGNRDVSRLGCVDEEGWVANDRDCDDEDGAINPDADDVCDDVDNDCNDVVDDGAGPDTGLWYLDSDADGYGDPDDAIYACDEVEGRVTNDDDCDDGVFEISPDASEVCDEVDNNCNDAIDEGVSTVFYRDIDLDGRGDPADSVRACAQPTGYVSNSDDCNDAEAAAWTGRPEVCDGIDNNCAGGIDEGVANIFWRDGDSDGFGNPLVSREACEAPTGWVDNPDDCDDTASVAYPGGTEVCDGYDNDCNGTRDDGVGSSWFIDNDGDGYGQTEIVACSQPPGTILRGGDCNDANPSVNPDALEYCATAYDDNCDGEANESSAVDATIWYIDADEDKQGEESPLVIWPVAQYSCSKPADLCLPFFPLCLERLSYVDNGLDCDDTSPLAQWRPGHPETCDGYDNDCNGTRDDGFARTNFYYDGDGDGVGRREISACTEPIDDPEGTWVTTCCDFDDDDEDVQ